eukprot:CCRYP_011575-RA/>CCRYP_011575-RA protein AED:0.08 eAED:0.08 QI:0/-1/0/1/-1/1/1/0/579
MKQEPSAEVPETENVIGSVVETTFLEDVGQEFTLDHSGLDFVSGVDEGRNEAESEREVMCNEREARPRDETADGVMTQKLEHGHFYPHLSEHENILSMCPELAIETGEDVIEVLAADANNEEVSSSDKDDRRVVQFGRIKRFQPRSIFKSKSKHKRAPAREAVLATFPELAIKDSGAEDEVEVFAVNKLVILGDLQKQEDSRNSKNEVKCVGIKKFKPKGHFIKLIPKPSPRQQRTIDEQAAVPKNNPKPEVEVSKTEVALDDNFAFDEQNVNSAGETSPHGQELSPSTSQQFAFESNEVFEVVLKGTLLDEKLFASRKQDETSVKGTNTKTHSMHSNTFPSQRLKNGTFDVEPEGTVAQNCHSFDQEEFASFIERTHSKKGSVVGSDLVQAKLDIDHESEARSQREDVVATDDNDETSRKEKIQHSGSNLVRHTDETVGKVLIDSILLNLAKAEVAAKADGDVDAQVKIHLLRTKILRITNTSDEWATKVGGIGDDDEPDEVFVSGPFKRLLSPVLENLEKAVNIIDRAILNGTTGVIMNTANLIDHQCIGNEREITTSDSGSLNSILDSEIESVFTA